MSLNASASPAHGLTHCVQCGSEAIHRKTVSVSQRNGRVVRGVIAEVCDACGERYYDLATMERLQAAAHERD